MFEIHYFVFQTCEIKGNSTYSPPAQKEGQYSFLCSYYICQTAERLNRIKGFGLSE